jgi:hypothetical protein
MSMVLDQLEEGMGRSAAMMDRMVSDRSCPFQTTRARSRWHEDGTTPSFTRAPSGVLFSDASVRCG